MLFCVAIASATWGVCETGATGPTGNRYGDDAGHACFAVAGPLERAVTLETGEVATGTSEVVLVDWY